MKFKPEYFRYLLFLAIAVYIPLEARHSQDFDIFLAASSDLIHGGNIFNHTYVNGFHFFYSPLFAILLAPFTAIPIYAARILWLTLNVLALFRCVRLIRGYFDFQLFSQKQKLLFDFVSIIFSLKLILDNFHNGQVTIFLLLFMLEGLRLINSGKPLWGAALIALGINFKFLPLVLLPWLFYNKQFKPIIYVLAWYGLFLFLPVLVTGFSHFRELMHDWLGLINPSNKAHLIDTDETSLNGLTTLIPTLLMEKVPDPYALELKRNILNLEAGTVMLIVNIVRFALVIFTLHFMRRKIFTQPGTIKGFYELSYIFLLIPLIFPHQQHYAFFLAFPASIYLLHRLFVLKISRGKIPLAMLSILVAVYLLTNAHLLLGEFREYYDHFKIISYGALLLLVLLACSPPLKKEIST